MTYNFMITVRKPFLAIKEKNMDCPHCKVDLWPSNKLGVEIDICPKCRGIWLDRGELEKIIAESKAEYTRLLNVNYKLSNEKQQQAKIYKTNSFVERVFDHDFNY